MTLTASLLLDLVILALLVYCFMMGMRRGLVLMICSLLSVILAFAGGRYLADNFSAPLQEKLEPVIVETILTREADAAQKSGLTDPAESSAPTNVLGLPEQFSLAVQEQLTQSAKDIHQTAVQKTASAIAATASRSILFLLGFTIIPFLWKIVSRALNLMAKLPGLHFLNKVLGGMLGLITGILILMVARWALCDLLGWIPAQVIAESRLLPLLASPLSIFSWIGTLTAPSFTLNS